MPSGDAAKQPSSTIQKIAIRFFQTAIVVGLVVITAGLALWMYPPLLPAALAAMNRSGDCGVLDVFSGAQTRYRFAKAQAAISQSARLVKNDGELELWQTLEGEYWIPAGNGKVLPILLAQQQANEYGDSSQGVHSGDIVLDCGAHIGVYTRKALQDGAKLVVAIEPAPINIECLRRNLSAEIAQGRVIVCPKGVWDKEELLPLFEDPENSAADSFVAANPNSKTKGVLPLVPIDLLRKEYNLERVDVIKMDIKGATVRALEGAKHTLATDRPRLIVSTEERSIDSLENIASQLGSGLGYERSCGSCSLSASLLVEPDVVFYQSREIR